MEFKSLRNIESSFRQIRLFGIVFLSLCAVVTVWSVWNSYRFAEKQREKIYVLDNGKSLMLALSQDLSQNRPAEAREHVRRFHEMFFTLSPEKSAIEHNVKRALLLADKSVYHYYSEDQCLYDPVYSPCDCCKSGSAYDSVHDRGHLSEPCEEHRQGCAGEYPSV